MTGKERKEMDEMKKVSIVMCTYNGEKYIKEQLDSIINQTYPLYEIIIQDDHSTDGTWGILEKYKETNPLIKIYKNESEAGVNGNFFSAMERTNGEYIAISDQDDIWELNKIENQINYIGNKLLCSCLSEPFSNDKNIKTHYDGRTPNYNLERIIFVGSALPGHTLLFKKELKSMIPNLQIWSKEFLYDHLLGITAAGYNSIAFYNKILVNHRCHSKAATYGTPNDYNKKFNNVIRTIKRTFCQYFELRPYIKLYFKKIYLLVSELPEENNEDTKKIALHLSQNSFYSFIEVELMCIKSKDKILFSKEKNKIYGLLRAMYFPISSSDYFTYLKKVYKIRT